MRKLSCVLCAVALGLSVQSSDVFAQRRGGGGRNFGGGGSRPAPQYNPAPRMQAPAVRVPSVSGGANVSGAARVATPGANINGGVNGAARVTTPGVNLNSASRATFTTPNGANRAVNQAIYRNNINIGQRSFSVAPNSYRPSYQNYPWHQGYWNNTYGWNPAIGSGRGYYGNYGGYGISLGNWGLGGVGLGGGLGGYGG